MRHLLEELHLSHGVVHILEAAFGKHFAINVLEFILGGTGIYAFAMVAPALYVLFFSQVSLYTREELFNADVWPDKRRLFTASALFGGIVFLVSWMFATPCDLAKEGWFTSLVLLPIIVPFVLVLEHPVGYSILYSTIFALFIVFGALGGLRWLPLVLNAAGFFIAMIIGSAISVVCIMFLFGLVSRTIGLVAC